jgi:uncharacterized membrane protein required for colicin V production
MNDRIKELMPRPGVFPYPDREMYTKEQLVHLAELIVQECCKLLKESGDNWEEFARNPPDGQEHNSAGALFAAYRLKEDAVDMLEEHFKSDN